MTAKRPPDTYDEVFRGAALPVFAWITLTAICLFVLQILPHTGIFLLMVGGPIITGALFVLALLAMFVESLIGRVPRWLVAVPIAVFGGYYAIVGYERSRLPNLPTLAGVDHTAGGLVFEPERHLLVGTMEVDMHYLLTKYQVPYIYEPASSRILTVGDVRSCETPTTNRLEVPRRLWIRALRETFCFSSHSTPAATEGLVTFESSRSDPVLDGIQVRIDKTAVLLNGNEVASTSTFRAELLPLIPMLFAGCGLDRAGWRCVTAVKRDWVVLWPDPNPQDTYPDYRAILTDQIAKLLSLMPRSPEQLSAITTIEN